MSFVTLVEEMFSTFTVVISGMAGGLKEAFLQLIYVDPEGATKEWSPLVIFLFVAGGVVLGMGLLTGIFGLIRGVAHR
ncbi:MAG: hypothetical protein IKC31_06290 [Clostridia bacterium]|nr:hypothetical protein [Clostridia bacterium]